jgi:hypothetical protein
MTSPPWPSDCSRSGSGAHSSLPENFPLPDVVALDAEAVKRADSFSVLAVLCEVARLPEQRGSSGPKAGMREARPPALEPVTGPSGATRRLPPGYGAASPDRDEKRNRRLVLRRGRVSPAATPLVPVDVTSHEAVISPPGGTLARSTTGARAASRSSGRRCTGEKVNDAEPVFSMSTHRLASGPL